MQLEEAAQKLEEATQEEDVKKPVTLRSILTVAREPGVMSILIIKVLLILSCLNVLK